MTKAIALSFGSEVSSTSISNIFIDEYMADARGADVKVYIYLLRCMSDTSMVCSVASISDKLDETEKDIIKALKYWEKKKLLFITWDPDGQISGIRVNPLTNQLPEDNTGIIELSPAVREQKPVTPAAARRLGQSDDNSEPETAACETSSSPAAVSVSKPNYTSGQLARFKEDNDFNSLLDAIESRFGTLNPKDLQTPAFLYDGLDMSVDLILFIYDYCQSKGKSSHSYVEKVASDWFSHGIDTVEKARAKAFSRSKECTAVKEAFSLSGTLGPVQLEFINRWIVEYGMNSELIREACNKTMLKKGEPNFFFADKILSDWNNANAHSMEEARRADEAHRQLDQQKRNARTTAASAVQPTAARRNYSFQQRSYTEEELRDIERRKLGIQ